MMSLGGITLGVGMIVDNSIVVLENIFTYRADGYDRLEACTKGTGEVIGAVIASTLTTVAVFLPIALSGRHAGMMFKEFCITIVALLLSSLIISITLVPLLCYFLLGGTKQRASSRRARRNADNRKAAVACIPQFAEFPDHPPLGRRRADRCHLYCQRAQRQPGGHGAHPGDG